jgi:putative transposase
MKWSTSPHRPPHLYIDDAWYFVTASTLEKAHILATDKHFDIWLNTFQEIIEEFKVNAAAWVILPNHYHCLFLPQQGSDLGPMIKRFHGRTSRELNLLDGKQGRSVWYSYWDTCIRGEHDFWTRFNYIHYNPVKHGYAQQPKDWQFSSYYFYLKNEDQAWFETYTQESESVDLFDNDKF